MKTILIILTTIFLVGCCGKPHNQSTNIRYIELFDTTHLLSNDSLLLRGIKPDQSDTLRVYKYENDSSFYLPLNLRASTQNCSFEITRANKIDTISIDYQSKAKSYYVCHTQYFYFDFYNVTVKKTTLNLISNATKTNNYYNIGNIGKYK